MVSLIVLLGSLLRHMSFRRGFARERHPADKMDLIVSPPALPTCTKRILRDMFVFQSGSLDKSTTLRVLVAADSFFNNKGRMRSEGPWTEIEARRVLFAHMETIPRK